MHYRTRHIEKILQKRAKMFPVLGILGPRQVGKSTFLRQWAKAQTINYLTFDKHEIATRAQRAPEQFLLAESQQQTTPLIIDEAQKVPHLFDSIKAIVDEERRMGSFILSGSVEFSSKSGVRESLAGRMGIIRLYPMTLRELAKQELTTPWTTMKFNHKNPLDPKKIEQWLIRGGMPIFCNFSDADERINLVNSWVEAICYRDLKQMKDGVYDSELALNILNTIAINPSISKSGLASELSSNHAAVKKHVAALESLFLLYTLPSFANPRANPEYRIFDAGVLNALIGGKQTIFSRHASLITLLINEINAQYEYAGKLKPKLYHYKTRGGAEIDLILQTKKHTLAIECTTKADIPPYQQRSMKSFLKNHPQATGYFIAPVQQAFQLDKNIQVIPWNSIG